MDDADDIRARWGAGLREAASRAYAASHGTEPPAPAPTRWRLDARTAASAAAVIALLAACAWWGLRPAAPVAAITPSPVASAAPATVVVHVSGAVARPGLVELAAGERVADAVDAAGGLARDADQSSVNLARLLVDGEHIVVTAEGEEPAGGVLVNLNTADAAALEALPGVGPVLAARIVADREAAGPFLSVEDLARVSGVGPAILADIADLATT